MRLHPHAAAYAGWANSQPSSKEYYHMGINVGATAPIKAGWSFTALFHSKDLWVMITETSLGMAMQPTYVQDFLRNLPPSWDDVKYIDGFPGEYAVMARQANGKWFVGGINSSNVKKELNLDFSSLGSVSKGVLISGKDARHFTQKEITLNKGKLLLNVESHDGFVIRFE